MGLLDDYNSGIGSPRPKWQHQRAMNKMAHRAYDELDHRGLEILSEATVTDDWDDLAPDLVIFNSYNIPVSIIEITTHRMLRPIIDKCYELIPRFPEAEYFVYDYESEILYKYDALHDLWLSSQEYNLRSQFLKKPVLDYLKF